MGEAPDLSGIPKEMIIGLDTKSAAQTKNLKYDSIDMKCLQCKEYNRLYGTKFSYGDFVSAIKNGRLEHPIPEIYNPPKNPPQKKIRDSKRKS